MHRKQVSSVYMTNVYVLFFFILIVLGVIFYLYSNQLKIENQQFQFQIAALINKIESFEVYHTNQENTLSKTDNTPEQALMLKNSDPMKEHTQEITVSKNDTENVLKDVIPIPAHHKQNSSIQQKRIVSVSEMNISENKSNTIMADEYRYKMMEHLNRGQYYLESSSLSY